MGSEQWTAGSGSKQWVVTVWQWTINSGQLAVNGRQWTVDSGQWTVGKWAEDSGLWQCTVGNNVGTGQWAAKFGLAIFGSFPKFSLFSLQNIRLKRKFASRLNSFRM